MAKLVFWLVVIGGGLYVLFGFVSAGWQWFSVSMAVDSAVQAQIPVYRERSADPWPSVDRQARLAKMRTAIARATADAGVVVDEDRLSITEEEAGLRVRLRWVHPIIVAREETVLGVPLSLDRSYAVSAAGGR